MRMPLDTFWRLFVREAEFLFSVFRVLIADMLFFTTIAMINSSLILSVVYSSTAFRDRHWLYNSKHAFLALRLLAGPWGTPACLLIICISALYIGGFRKNLSGF
jgi:hypothetical protein